jgi:hypothetical protein
MDTDNHKGSKKFSLFPFLCLRAFVVNLSFLWSVFICGSIYV